MSDVEDRLAALDPAANQPYHHADLDAMITRIVATPARARSTPAGSDSRHVSPGAPLLPHSSRPSRSSPPRARLRCRRSPSSTRSRDPRRASRPNFP